jgi:hypothetical protein
MSSGVNHYRGTPLKLVYRHETGYATLDVRTETKTIRLWAEGEIATALLRQVNRDTETIAVTVDSSDMIKIVAFTLP